MTDLRPADLETFARFGIEASLLEAAGVHRVTHQEARDEIGIRYRSEHLEGIVFPYVDPTSGELRTARLRRDHPEVEADGSPIGKYLAPPDRHHLFFPPGAHAVLADPSVLVAIVEAEKSALTLTAAARRLGRRVLAIATGGCWGWWGEIGKTTNATGARVPVKGPLPDLARVTWTNREVVILFDANAASNAKVQAARRKFADDLQARGARVRIGDVPAEPGINGPDDFRAVHDDAAVWALLETAKPHDQKKGKPAKVLQGRAIELKDPEPWPDPVDGSVLMAGLTTKLTKHLAVPVHAPGAVALWTLHAFTIDASFISPVLSITSPVKQCGKSSLLIVLGALVPRGLLAASITPAGVFRTIEKFHPTLLIDEADTFLGDNPELRGVLNAGHTRKTAIIIRPVGDDHEPRIFSSWCAKAVALIGKLPPTLADRSIEVAMRRRMPHELVDQLRQDMIDAECADLQRQAARWALDHLDALKRADPPVPAGLSDRAADCWRPLLAIADAIGGEWPRKARDAATALAGTTDPDIGAELLTDIRTIFDEYTNKAGAIVPVPNELEEGAIKTEVLLKKLHEMADRPWPLFGKTEKPLSSHKLARLLKPFSIFSADRVYFTDGRARGYRVDAFDDAFARYLPLKVSQCPDANNDGPKPAFSKRPADPGRDTLKTPVSSMNTGLGDVGTLDQGENRGDDDVF
jgi:hypothetical protein